MVARLRTVSGASAYVSCTSATGQHFERRFQAPSGQSESCEWSAAGARGESIGRRFHTERLGAEDALWGHFCAMIYALARGPNLRQTACKLEANWKPKRSRSDKQGACHLIG